MASTSLPNARLGHGSAPASVRLLLYLEQFALQNRAAVELQPSGGTELDAVLGGGFPRGSLVELCGPASSERTSLAFSLLAEATELEQV